MPSVFPVSDRQRSGRSARAIRAIQKKLEDQGGSAADWYGLGELLLVERRFADALAAMRKAVELAPGNTRFLGGLALALSWNRCYEEAIRMRLSLQHRNASDVAALADDMKYAHDFAGAIAVVDEAEAHGKASAAAKVVRGQARLFLGRYGEGFADMEWRFEAGMSKQPKVMPDTRWDGGLEPGLRLLVCPDQGIGDDILMIRFLRVAAAAGVRATFLARRPLERLLGASDIGAEVVSVVRDLSAFDAWCPVGSLPHLLGFDGTPPAPIALSVPSEAVARGRAITADHADAYRIGVCWTGNPKYPRNAMRSTSPRAFEPLARLDGVALFSLYKGEAVDALAAAGMNELIVDACSDDFDFADTAGLVSQLDLVISTDTAVVHLAASLGKPVWNLLPQEGIWQYGTGGDTTPWYPSMRLFRQPRRGDWDSVMQQVEAALSERLQARSGDTNRSS